MIIRKVKEIDSQGKMISTSKVDLDTKNVNIDQNKRTEASKKIEVNNIQANVLKGGKEDSTELNLSLIHISEPTRLGMISYAVFCLKKKN